MTNATPLRGAIVAMNREHVIGVDGTLPWHYPEDLKRFKRRTMGCAVVMGRKTWESIRSTPLPGRRNIVISRNEVPDVECHNNLEAALKACGDMDAWIIGGGQIYASAMPLVDILDVTLVPDKVAMDTTGIVRFPEIDPNIWMVSEEKPIGESPRLQNTVYIRRDTSD